MTPSKKTADLCLSLLAKFLLYSNSSLRIELHNSIEVIWEIDKQVEIVQTPALNNLLDKVSATDDDKLAIITLVRKDTFSCYLKPLVVMLAEKGVNEQFGEGSSIFFKCLLLHFSRKKIDFEKFCDELDKAQLIKNNLIDLNSFYDFAAKDSIFKAKLPPELKKKIVYGNSIKFMNLREQFYAFCNERKVIMLSYDSERVTEKLERQVINKKTFKREGTLFGVGRGMHAHNEVMKKSKKEEKEMVAEIKFENNVLFVDNDDMFSENLMKMAKEDVETEEECVAKPMIKKFHASMSIINLPVKNKDKKEELDVSYQSNQFEKEELGRSERSVKIEEKFEVIKEKEIASIFLNELVEEMF